jgi:hypothetical protein
MNRYGRDTRAASLWLCLVCCGLGSVRGLGLVSGHGGAWFGLYGLVGMGLGLGFGLVSLIWLCGLGYVGDVGLRYLLDICRLTLILRSLAGWLVWA